MFETLGKLRDNKTKLFDLKARQDLTAENVYNEFMVMIGSIRSDEELGDISRRSLRSRLNNFESTGSWPTGTHPFGYGKACYNSANELLWEWHPESRLKGQVFCPDSTGNLVAGRPSDKLPRKSKRDLIRLIPNRNADFAETVKLVFKLFTVEGLSFRQISARLNQLHRKFYDKPFTHSLVSQILRNPAYAGEIHFGKTQSGELSTFDDKGLVVNVADRFSKPQKRPIDQRIIKRETHEALVARHEWDLAQAKLTDVAERVCYSPRNPSYYLRPLLICGHCGCRMAARTESAPKSGKRTVVYLCSTYVNRRCSGQEMTCRYYKINHDDAERLLREKLSESGVDFQPEKALKASKRALYNRMVDLEQGVETNEQLRAKLIANGLSELQNYLAQNYDLTSDEIESLCGFARCLYDPMSGGVLSRRHPVHLKISLEKLREVMTEVEVAIAKRSQKKSDQLQREFEKYTKKWAMADGMAAEVLKKEMDKIEAQLEKLKPRTVPLRQRIRELNKLRRNQEDELWKLEREWPNLGQREKGESLKRYFKSVTLFWSTKRVQSSVSGSRSRDKSTLLTDKIRWDLGDFNLEGAW